MFERDVSLYLDDIQESICAIEEFTRGIDFDFFVPTAKPILQPCVNSL